MFRKAASDRRPELCVVHRDRSSRRRTSGGPHDVASGGYRRRRCLLRPSLKSIRRCTNRERSAGCQTRSLNSARARTIVRASRGAVAHNSAAQVRRIGHRDVRRASNRWQLRVAYRDREGTSGRVARAVGYFKSIRRYAHREGRPGG